MISKNVCGFFWGKHKTKKQKEKGQKEKGNRKLKENQQKETQKKGKPVRERLTFFKPVGERHEKKIHEWAGSFSLVSARRVGICGGVIGAALCETHQALTTRAPFRPFYWADPKTIHSFYLVSFFIRSVFLLFYFCLYFGKYFKYIYFESKFTNFLNR